MRLRFFGLLAVSLFLNAYDYYLLDNKTPATTDQILDDPFLALRARRSNEDILRSLYFEWESALDPVDPIPYPFFPSSTHSVELEEARQDLLKIATDSQEAEKIHWQISDDPYFEHILPSLSQKIPFHHTIIIPPLLQTFLSPNRAYYARVRVCTSGQWSFWSLPRTFIAERPPQPTDGECTALDDKTLRLTWSLPSISDDVRFLIYGSTEAGFMPEFYDPQQENLILETAATEASLPNHYDYIRLIAIKDGIPSVPSELIYVQEALAGSIPQAPELLTAVEGYQKHPLVSEKNWNALKPFFLPRNHPIRHKLDKIFGSKKRVMASTKSLAKTGFHHPKARKWTRLIVTKHADLPGYIFKLYTDQQHNHRKHSPEHHFAHRIVGVNLIKNKIAELGASDLFATPKKWIYPLPLSPPPKGDAKYPKYFILVEQDMNLPSDSENYAKWKSSFVTKKTLNFAYKILEELGLWDCPKPDNMPITRSGKIAFIDTGTYYSWPVKHYRLGEYLSPTMQLYWKNLTSSAKK